MPDDYDVDVGVIERVDGMIELHARQCEKGADPVRLERLGQRLASGDFEGGKSGAVKVLGNLGFTVQEIQRR